jgi:hypothetical protein
MTVQEDARVELHAAVHASRDDVVGACVRAASALTYHGQSIVEPTRVVVKVLPGLMPLRRNVSPLVAITLESESDGVTTLVARMERYKTLQSRFFFIHLGPKRLCGMGQYRKLLRTLEVELRRVDSGGGEIQWVGLSS